MTSAILALFVWLGGQAVDLPPAFPHEGAAQLIDNNRVTVWEVHSAKGMPSSLHRHKFDMAGVDLADATVRVRSDSGSSQTSTVKKGSIVFIQKGVTHIEEVTSGKPRHAILIDLKDVAVPPIENKTGVGTAFPRDGAKKVLDNNRVVVWDYTWTPGKPTPMHFHDKDVVVVYLANGELKSTTPDGKSEVNVITVGLTRFNARNRTHNEELVKGAARAIIFELK